jgi:hypothetical protein
VVFPIIGRGCPLVRPTEHLPDFIREMLWLRNTGLHARTASDIPAYPITSVFSDGSGGQAAIFPARTLSMDRRITRLRYARSASFREKESAMRPPERFQIRISRPSKQEMPQQCCGRSCKKRRGAQSAGFCLFHGNGGSGDLVIELRIVLHEKPDEKVTDLMRHMREGLYL